MTQEKYPKQREIKHEHQETIMKKTLVASDKGAILVVCMLILVVLSLMGVAAIMTTSTEIKISANSRKAEQAFFSADAGVEQARTDIDYEDTVSRNTTDPIGSVPGDPFAYQVTIMHRVEGAESTHIFNVESRGWDPLNRSQRIIRADIEISRTRGAVDEGGYGAGY